MNLIYDGNQTIDIPAQATKGPRALERAPSERKIPITFPFSSPSPANTKQIKQAPIFRAILYIYIGRHSM